MERITLTCPLTGVPFQALKYETGNLTVTNPITGKAQHIPEINGCYQIRKEFFEDLDVMTADDAANVLDVSNARITALCQAGKLEHVKLPVSLYINRKSVDEYEQTRKNGRPRKEV